MTIPLSSVSTAGRSSAKATLRDDFGGVKGDTHGTELLDFSDEASGDNDNVLVLYGSRSQSLVDGARSEGGCESFCM